MWPVAIFLMLVVAFYWFAFCGTIWFWMNALFSLCRLHFIRAAIWFVCGCWMMLWWYDKPGRELTWDDNGYLFFAAFWIGLGALGTFVRWRKKQQANADHTNDADVDTANRSWECRPVHQGQGRAQAGLN